MDSHLSLRNVTKTYTMDYGSITPLKGVSLEVPRGESMAIMGPSGSGKSTLMNILGCLDRPTEGAYLFEEVDTAHLNDHQLSKIRAEKIGFVFQSFHLIPHLTVYENLLVPFQYLEKCPENLEELIVESLEMVNLSHRLTHSPNELSGGEMQRVAIARTIAKKPAIILADEPTGNLDTKNSDDVVQLLKEINSQGVTLVVITHDGEVSRQFCREVKMRDGEMIIED